MVKRYDDLTIEFDREGITIGHPKAGPPSYGVWIASRLFVCVVVAALGSAVGRGIWLATADSCLTWNTGESFNEICVHRNYLDMALALLGGMVLCCLGLVAVTSIVGVSCLLFRWAFMTPVRPKPKSDPFEELP